MEEKELKSIIEAILFASGDPVAISQICKVTGVPELPVISSAEALAQEYSEKGRGIRLVRIEDKLQLVSSSEYSEFVSAALERRKPPKLSQASLEVLAIVAYYGPLTRSKIDKIRGVDSSYTVSALFERNLIEQNGYLEAPGRPALYVVGEAFYRVMGISDLSQLPPLPDLGTAEGIIELSNKIEQLKMAGEVSPVSLIQE